MPGLSASIYICLCTYPYLQWFDVINLTTLWLSIAMTDWCDIMCQINACNRITTLISQGVDSYLLKYISVEVVIYQGAIQCL